MVNSKHGKCGYIFPTKLYKKLLEHQSDDIKTDSLFLTPNSAWQQFGKWFKNCSVGPNTIAKWMQDCPKETGIDSKLKITNQINRASE